MLNLSPCRRGFGLEIVMGDPLRPNLPPLGRRWMRCGAVHGGTNSILTSRPSARVAIWDLVSSASLAQRKNIGSVEFFLGAVTTGWEIH
jgi:hypothetical protein